MGTGCCEAMLECGIPEDCMFIVTQRLGSAVGLRFFPSRFSCPISPTPPILVACFARLLVTVFGGISDGFAG